MPTEEQTYRQGVKADLKQIKDDQRTMMTMVKYTNGKVRKIIIALVLIPGTVSGQTFGTPPDITPLAAGIFKFMAYGSFGYATFPYGGAKVPSEITTISRPGNPAV